MKQILLNVENVTKQFPLQQPLLSRISVKNFRFQVRQEAIHALNGISFNVRKGEIFALVGESGCGKSTLARIITGLYSPTLGRISYKGTEISQLGFRERQPFRKKIQMIFQDPFSALNPRKKVVDIIGQPLLLYGYADRHNRADAVAELLTQVGLDPDYGHRYPHQFSGGQRQRIGIARALACRPEFIVADEPTSALDVSVQAQILNLLMSLQKEFNLSYIMVSHNLSVIQHLCDRVAVMYMGCIVEMGSVEDIFNNPCHPYTRALFSAIPSLTDPVFRDAELLTGEVGSLKEKPDRCPFFHRCASQMPACRLDMPGQATVGEGHTVMCHKYPG